MIMDTRKYFVGKWEGSLLTIKKEEGGLRK